jgi:hypothetical protein
MTTKTDARTANGFIEVFCLSAQGRWERPKAARADDQVISRVPAHGDSLHAHGTNCAKREANDFRRDYCVVE